MHFLSKIPDYHRPIMVKALEKVGYPRDTLLQVKEILAI